MAYVVTCLFGLEDALAAEVAEKLGAAGERHWCEVVFPFDGSAARLKELRVGINVFLRFDNFRIGRTVSDTSELAARLRRLPLDLWAKQWAELTGQEPTSQDICVSVKRRGEHNFTFRDLEELAFRALAEATGRVVVLDARPLELRIEVHREWCRLSGRLTPVPLSRRPYKRYRAPNETDPALAAAMVRYSRPRQDDLFLDPFCGTGTIPIERAALSPAAQIVAGEINAKRVSWAVANARLADAAISFGMWDGLKLPFRDRAFTRIVTNPPQSNPESGRPWRTAEFGALVGESLRVLGYGGLAVWLVRREATLKRVLKRFPQVRVVQRRACNWKGKPCAIYVLRKEL